MKLFCIGLLAVVSVGKRRCHILFLVLHYNNNTKIFIMMEVVFIFYFHQKREREKAYLCIYE